MVAAILNGVELVDLVSVRHDSSELAKDADCSSWTPCRTSKPPAKGQDPNPEGLTQG